jgi:NADH-quinone oxidoreductase subunit I
MRNPITPLAKGLALTFRHLGRERTTVQYPEEMPQFERRFRGLHELRRWPNGLERCIGCSLCAGACPSMSIRVVAAENTDEERYSPGERYAKIYEINELRCIFCGYCEEACPTGAIVLRGEFEISDYQREDFIYGKERLLVPVEKRNEARHTDDPWER